MGSVCTSQTPRRSTVDHSFISIDITAEVRNAKRCTFSHVTSVMNQCCLRSHSSLGPTEVDLTLQNEYRYLIIVQRSKQSQGGVNDIIMACPYTVCSLKKCSSVPMPFLLQFVALPSLVTSVASVSRSACGLGKPRDVTMSLTSLV